MICPSVLLFLTIKKGLHVCCAGIALLLAVKAHCLLMICPSMGMCDQVCLCGPRLHRCQGYCHWWDPCWDCKPGNLCRGRLKAVGWRSKKPKDIKGLDNTGHGLETIWMSQDWMRNGWDLVAVTVECAWAICFCKCNTLIDLGDTFPTFIQVLALQLGFQATSDSERNINNMNNY